MGNYLFICGLLAIASFTKATTKYEPHWNSLDTRPLPPWYDQAKVGIFLHWGVFSVPGYVSEWFWWYWVGQGDPKNKLPAEYMKQNYPPGFTYPAFAKDFTCELFDPEAWARIFEESGARYVVLTTKHHEGYTLWPSKLSFNWNAMDVGPKRDLVGDLADAIRNKTKLAFGVYHSLFEWFNPLFLVDKENNFTTDFFVKGKTMPEMYELVERYKPDIFWSDGDHAPDTYWKSEEFVAWLYNDSPIRNTVVTNDRWGNGCSCKHGGYYTCDNRYNPGVLQPHKWENAMTLDRYSWGYRRDTNLSDVIPIEELIATLVQTISCGGNILINIGPTSYGRIPIVYQERLQQLGQWLKVNGDAVYGSKPWQCQNDTLSKNVWYTKKRYEDDSEAVFVFLLKWPKESEVILGSLEIGNNTTITMLGAEDQPVTAISKPGKHLILKLPPLTPDLLPSLWAWVLRVDGKADGHCPR